MGKKTDHKKLWRKEKARNLLLHNEIARLRDVVKGQAETIE